MTVKELKKMIAEEYAAYSKNLRRNRKLYEQPAPEGPVMDDPMVAVSDNDIDIEGGEDAEATLKDIFDMLKDYFEGDKGGDDADTGDDAGDDADDAGDEDEEKDAEALQERFKKLANIIKG